MTSLKFTEADSSTSFVRVKMVGVRRKNIGPRFGRAAFFYRRANGAAMDFGLGLYAPFQSRGG